MNSICSQQLPDQARREILKCSLGGTRIATDFNGPFFSWTDCTGCCWSSSPIVALGCCFRFYYCFWLQVASNAPPQYWKLLCDARRAIITDHYDPPGSSTAAWSSGDCRRKGFLRLCFLHGKLLNLNVILNINKSEYYDLKSCNWKRQEVSRGGMGVGKSACFEQSLTAERSWMARCKNKHTSCWTSILQPVINKNYIRSQQLISTFTKIITDTFLICNHLSNSGIAALCRTTVFFFLHG